jgi:hypothetical protein
MTDENTFDGSIPDDIEKKSADMGGTRARAVAQGLSSLIPYFGGLLSAAAGVWSEQEQREINDILVAWLRMVEAEMREKQRVMAEIVARLDMHDEKIKERVKSDEYQTLLRKAFRNWSGTESHKKQVMLRNLLCNAAGTQVSSDHVVSLFIEWLQKFSELHFAVIGDLYQNEGATRAEIWDRVGIGDVREDSADADLFKLLVRDLSTGSIIRQHRETDYHGNFIAKRPASSRSQRGATRQMKSAFDDSEQYELTALGRAFVHYALSELTIKIEFQAEGSEAA